MGDDPVFTTRAELVAWAEKKAKRTRWNVQMAPTSDAALRALENGFDEIKRVTLAHAHLEDDYGTE
jgi:hypothetical protein